MKKSYVAEVHFLEKEGVYLTTEQAAEYVGRSVHSLENMRNKKSGAKYTKTADGRVLYRVSDLVAWFYRFEAVSVRSSEAKKTLDKAVLLDYELYLEGDDTINLAGNLKTAIESIRNEIFKNRAEGFLCFEYRCGKIMAQLHISEDGAIYYARYKFTAE